VTCPRSQSPVGFLILGPVLTLRHPESLQLVENAAHYGSKQPQESCWESLNRLLEHNHLNSLMGFNCLEGIQHSISRHWRRVLETVFSDNDVTLILESVFMFTKHFIPFSYLILDPIWDCMSGSVFVYKDNDILERVWWCWRETKGAMGLLSTTFFPAYLGPGACCAPWAGASPHSPTSPCPLGSLYLTCLPSELSDFRGTQLLLPAKVFYWLELMSMGTHWNASSWVSQTLQMQLLRARSVESITGLEGV
jgi:hypothetical protein